MARPRKRIVAGPNNRTGFGAKGGSIRVTGVMDAKRTIRRLAKESPEKLAKGLHDAGKFLKKMSQAECPVDTGFLRRSAYFRVTKLAKGPRLDVGYTADYAFWVHERLDVFHPVGNAKFLERPARRYRRHLKWLIVRRFK